jgi:DNA-directed RNA polymerase specialized sigma24 family protein
MRPDELPRIAHDPATFEAFYREHVEAVLRFITRRVADPHLAGDLTAEVFLAAIDAAPSLSARRPLLGLPVVRDRDLHRPLAGFCFWWLRRR